ncbi:MAG: peptide ABC transporter substrate-binding protein [Vicingaceae bacterium]|nr:peptide ABC transporter substrate-binding protein [Vicingaceae bacterium]
MKPTRLLYTALISVILLSCGDESNTKNETKEDIKKTNIISENILDFASSDPYQTLDPIKITDVNSFQIQSQIFEGLLRFDENDLSLKPALASFWDVDDAGLLYTFHLNKGIYFHDNACFDGKKGKELTAKDVVYTFKRICMQQEDNYAFSVFNEIIRGVKELNLGSEELEGVKAIDDFTVQFTLTKTSSSFLQMLATPFSAIVCEEAISAGAVVGTGPFVYDKSLDTENSITLTRNNNYHLKDNGNQLPYVAGVKYNYIVEGRERLAAFKEGKIDILENIPVEEINNLVQENISAFQNKPAQYVLARNKELAITYLNFNTAVAPFNNVKLRKAFALAIDKNKIVDRVLKGEAYGPAINGIVPPAVKNYDYSSIIGIEFDVAKAKKTLADAGYGPNKALPKLEIVSSKESVSVRVALEIQKQLKSNLNINAEVTSMSLSEMLKYKSSSNVSIIVSSWLAEFPDPLSFLSILYGGYVNSDLSKSSYPNDARYKNAAFDKVYIQAMEATDETRKMELCLEADQIAANEVPIIPLWYYERYQLIQSKVKNYTPNAMRIHYLPYVKIEQPQATTKIETH